jgi:hypothetical protein
MSQEPDQLQSDPLPSETVDDNGEIVPRVPIDTTGTGSYIAVTCSVMAILATLTLVAGLLIVRWVN